MGLTRFDIPAGPTPRLLDAVTEQMYVFPTLAPVTMIDWALELVLTADRVLPPLCETQVAVNRVMGEPFPEAPKNCTTSAPAMVLLADAFTTAGAVGAPILIAGEAVEVGPVPSALICEELNAFGPVPSVFIAATLNT